ncbi:MAG TPA: hypothetical protein VMT04_08810 [Terriglobales bacterium]|nr:hypothetical protein [Terriglobales bacterium]
MARKLQNISDVNNRSYSTPGLRNWIFNIGFSSKKSERGKMAERMKWTFILSACIFWEPKVLAEIDLMIKDL